MVKQVHLFNLIYFILCFELKIINFLITKMKKGSGKTHTMLGSAANRVPGMYVLASHDIFKAL